MKEQVEKGQGADDSAEIEKLRKVVERGGAALRQSQEKREASEKEIPLPPQLNLKKAGVGRAGAAALAAVL